LKERLEERYAAVSQGKRSQILEQLLSQQEMALSAASPDESKEAKT
jgi:hypothetical protein